MFRDGDKFSATKIGVLAINNRQTRINKVWGHGHYTGSDLKLNSMRPGAYDFLRYPSLMGEKRIYRKDAV